MNEKGGSAMLSIILGVLGISLAGAGVVHFAKESADIILLEKDLKVLLDGVKERKKNFW